MAMVVMVTVIKLFLNSGSILYQLSIHTLDSENI